MPITLEQFHALRADAGRELLARVAAEPPGEALPLLERYRRAYPAGLVAAALELTRLRRKAAAKFSNAGAMWFTRDGLEMASSEAVAAHVARRFAGLPLVLDLCCGIGGDLLALAAVARRAVAVEQDALALELARANLEAIPHPHPPLPGGEGAATFIHADVTAFIPDGLALMPFCGLLADGGMFIDPSRRAARAAARRPEAYAPPLSWCLALTRYCPRVAITVSPALDFAEIDAEVEVISLHGECKEAVLWLGDFHAVARRATVLPAGAALTDVGPSSDALGEIGAYLYEPDAAVIRAGLLRRLAGELGLRRIDPDIAYLTGEAPVTSPFVTGFQVREIIPWSLKRLNAGLAARRIGRVEIKKRGFPLTPEALRPKLKLTGAAAATLICTRARGTAVVLIADRLSRDGETISTPERQKQ
ncbi:MAG TPA: SAM-dependent methyltransferase [Armatimonadota bacterium]|nr:SAM-dependent methyltransferase [Armatimonadota bacterium]HOS42435.1 SAM-dependent methyltransferase [Armatimonadota bacterium]